MLDQLPGEGDKEEALTLGTEPAGDKSLPHLHGIETTHQRYKVVEVTEVVGGEVVVEGTAGTQGIIVVMVTLEMAGEETSMIFQMGDLPLGNRGEEVREDASSFIVN